MEAGKKVRIVILAIGFLLLAAGAGTATMHSVTGNSAFCASCHIMDNYMSSWEHSSHREIAGCNDCHTDQRNLLTKTWSKVKAGTLHGYVNYLTDHPDYLELYDSSRDIVQANCVSCHSDLIFKTSLANPSIGGKYCFDCHSSVPHDTYRPRY
ncbi:NapC/NirT family cytochrome c [Heliorestis convoluta]|uniref:Cytochrome c nitrite reductase, small subunit n=1 Tax=Heliorestis convoluta TaxID=356322 RepID=A0A5Q2N1R2_9FIRM|nr:NapC/NirT family cytochrome c [Heliorestis convoluta]QGG49324.1 Cytochrome c nitrite reductase, small subunit [Heliorestis convoluta]